jgi:hypothetical protein
MACAPLAGFTTAEICAGALAEAGCTVTTVPAATELSPGESSKATA